MTVATGVRRAAVYARVSSDDQRERETIQTQLNELARRLDGDAGVEVVDRYVDDGVSGMIPMADRFQGARLLRDLARGGFGELWVYRVDRLGRKAQDMLGIYAALTEAGVTLKTVVEGDPDDLSFGMFAVVGQHVRKQFLRNSADGMRRAAEGGRYTGGVVALGYRVEGHKQTAHLVPDESPIWGDLSAADLVRRIYTWIALDGWSCPRVASELNSLGVPTACARKGTGVRTRKTQTFWRAGLIGNMVRGSIYKGQLSYGRRTKKRDREVIVAPIEGLVSPALWDEAQAALARNGRCAKNTHRIYLLKGVVKCGICGLTYVGSWSKEFGWYRCGGQLRERGPIPGKCLGVSVRTDRIEPAIWADIEAWLRNPGDVLDELDHVGEREAAGAIVEAQAITLRRALDSLDEQKARLIRSLRMGVVSDIDVVAELEQIKLERNALEARVAVAEAPVSEVVPQEARDLVSELRGRLDGGLTDSQRQEIVRLLVGIVLHTTVGDDGKKSAKALVTYRFPGVVETRTGTGSWPQRAGTCKETRPPDPLGQSQPARPRGAGGALRGRPGRTPAAHPGTGFRCAPS